MLPLDRRAPAGIVWAHRLLKIRKRLLRHLLSQMVAFSVGP